MDIEIKICGLTNRDDAQAALDYGADYIGFVLYQKSPRGITVKKLDSILNGLHGTFKAVGLFVNEERSEIEKVAEGCGLCAVQLHGDERISDFRNMPLVTWKAIKFYNGICNPSPKSWEADRYIIDATVPGAYGGSGVVADWGKAALLTKHYKVMLAGGLVAENVARAISLTKPIGVDVSSGVESAPGKKDKDKIKKFITEARSIKQ